VLVAAGASCVSRVGEEELQEGTDEDLYEDG